MHPLWLERQEKKRWRHGVVVGDVRSGTTAGTRGNVSSAQCSGQGATKAVLAGPCVARVVHGGCEGGGFFLSLGRVVRWAMVGEKRRADWSGRLQGIAPWVCRRMSSLFPRLGKNRPWAAGSDAWHVTALSPALLLRPHRREGREGREGPEEGERGGCGRTRDACSAHCPSTPPRHDVVQAHKMQAWRGRHQ